MELSESKGKSEIAYDTRKKLPYDVIIGHDLMKEIKIDVLYSEYVVVWDGVILPMHKIHNVKWMDLNLMDQVDPDTIKEQFIRLGRILKTKYKNSDLKQEVNKLIHLIKFQRVILLSSIKCYENIFDGNLGEWTGTTVETPLKEKSNPYHEQDLLITVIHLEDFKKYLDRLVVIDVQPKINHS